MKSILKSLFLALLWTLAFYSCSSPRYPEQFRFSSNYDQIKIGFGSCLKQDKPMPIFQSIKKDNFNLFLMLGDNVYGDTERSDLMELKLAYKKQKENFKSQKFNFPFEAIWDDHDYGLNDAGREYPSKTKSKDLFLDFWNVPMNDIRRNREGLYHEKLISLGDKKLQLIFLDTRSFRDNLLKTDEYGSPGKERYIPNQDSTLTILGYEQWSWLQEKLNTGCDFRIIISSIQFLPIGHGWESWNNFPYERLKLIKMIENSTIKNTIFISGDRHRGGFYKKPVKKGYNIYEITSSSLNASFPNKEEYGPLRLGKTYIEENYGSISISSSKGEVLVDLMNIKGETLKSIKINN